MPNIQRGEISAVIDGEERVLCLTLGAVGQFVILSGTEVTERDEVMTTSLVSRHVAPRSNLTLGAGVVHAQNVSSNLTTENLAGLAQRARAGSMTVIPARYVVYDDAFGRPQRTNYFHFFPRGKLKPGLIHVRGNNAT
jgi:hypothetical protein